MMMKKTSMIIIMFLVAAVFQTTEAIPIAEIRLMAARNNITGVLVFGDSSVDSGNNNYLATTSKSNFLPYGMDFFHGHPSGRFSNGKLATDYIAEALGYAKAIRAFLKPGFSRTIGVSHGVSFASANSGYDNLTAQLSNVLSMSHQIEHFMHYKMHLRQKVGAKKTEESIRNSVFILSMGTNDFLQNYYVELTRKAQYNVEQYEDYLISLMLGYIKKMHTLGAKRLVVVGVVPFGCLPLVKTLKGLTKCDDEYNKVALSFNNKMNKVLISLRTSLRMKTALLDAYSIVQSAIQNPTKYGFVETSKGCCGTGTVEYGITCKGLDTCSNRSSYVFWDAVHPTDQMYKIVAEDALNSLITNII